MITRIIAMMMNLLSGKMAIKNGGIKMNDRKRVVMWRWRPSWYWDQCMPEDENKETEKLWKDE